METQESKVQKPKSKWLIPTIVIVGIIFLGLGTWAGYNHWIKSKNYQQPVQEQQKDEFTDWRTYRNEEYGFEFKLPPKWKDAVIEQIHDEFYNGEIFLIKLEDKNVCDISVYPNEAWEIYQKADTTGKPIYLTSKGDLIFGWGCGQDDYGYKGFEDFNNAIDNGNFDAINSGKILGPFAEFKSLILPTFKFIEPYTIQWEKEPVELDYTELGWPKEWSKEFDDGSLCEINVMDGPSNPVMTPYRVGRFMSGEYAGGEIITLFTAYATMGSQEAFLDRFIKLNNNYINLVNNSSPIDLTHDCMGEFLKEFWNYKIDKKMLINELIPPETLNGAKENQKIYHKEYSDRNDFVFCKDPWDDKYVCKDKIAFKDVDSGITVYFGTGAKGEDFSIRMPDGFEKTYTFKYEEIEKTNKEIILNTGEIIQEEYTAYWISCATPVLSLTDLQKEDLLEIGKNASGGYIYLDKANKETRLLYDEITAMSDSYRPFRPFTKIYGEFEKELPLFFWIDPFERTIKFIRKDYYRDFLAPDGCS